MPEPDDTLAAAHRLVASAERITVLAGAGVSTDSGIADFRGPDGVWTRDPEAEKLSDISYYVSDPEIRRRAWAGRVRWFGRQLQPNPGHLALAELEHQGRLVSLVTQNVDGLHVAAGNSPERVVEVHGTIREVVCLDCGERSPSGPTLDRVRAGEDDPGCLACGGILKSATVSFGQNLDPYDLSRAFASAGECDLLLAVGTSLRVYPIADMVDHARWAEAAVVIVNAEPTPLDDVADAVVRGSLSDVLPVLVSPEGPGLGNT